jgi:rhodanese-related sulfurtransferase
MKAKIAFLTLFFAFFTTGLFAAQIKTPTYDAVEKSAVNVAGSQAISYDDFQKIHHSGEPYVLIDVRKDVDFRAGHIEGAISIPLNTFTEQKIETYVPDKNTRIVVYCASFTCPMSVKATEFLKKAGFLHVLDYKGGTKEWQERGQTLKSLPPLEGQAVQK